MSSNRSKSKVSPSPAIFNSEYSAYPEVIAVASNSILVINLFLILFPSQLQYIIFHQNGKISCVNIRHN